MDSHVVFVGDTCDACHKSGSRGEVFLNFSKDSSLSKSCVGCHGRDEDVTGNCTGEGTGLEAECGSGAGLRQMHALNVPASDCDSCHSSDPTPIGEQTLPFNYGLAGVVMQSSCDGDGTESQFGATGLDNDGDGQRDSSDSDCQGNTPPTQPGTLSASAVTTSSATVSWGASTDNEGDTITYTVEYRRVGDVSWSSAGSTTSTSRPLSGLDSSQAYDVRVTPNDSSVDGTTRLALNLFTTQAPPNTPPTQPGTLSASALTTSSATVSWGASTDNEGDTITYTVEYRRVGDVSWSSAGSTTSTSRSLSGLDSSQAYDVRVTPNDGSVDGTTRLALNLFTTQAPPNTPPTQPGTLSASAVTTNSATVSWGASTDDDGDDITYQVDYRRNGGVPWTSAGSTSGTSQPLTGLDSSQAYDVRVTPNDGAADGADRTTLSLFTTADPPNTPPTQPGTLSASTVTTNSATVSWSASTDTDGDDITYQVDYRRNGEVPWTSAGSTSGTSQPLTGLDSSQAYDVRVTPNDGTDDGADRAALNLFTTQASPNTPPTQPGTLSASAVTTSTATVSWGASNDNEGDTITYQVDYRRNGDVPWTSAGSTTGTSQPLSGLDSSQAYDVRVTPNDGTDDGADRAALNLFTTQASPNTPPTQPGTLSASAVTTSSATVSWGASNDNEGDTITYQVDYRRNGDVPWTSAGSTTGTSQPLSGLDSSQAYDVRVTPNDGTDDGADRAALNLFTTQASPNTPPTQPGTLSASAVTTSSATVSWGASNDNEGDTITYQVDYRRNGDVPWASAGSTTTTSRVLSGLDADQFYDVRVIPNDGSEDGPDRTVLKLFQTESNVEVIFKNSFEGN